MHSLDLCIDNFYEKIENNISQSLRENVKKLMLNSVKQHEFRLKDDALNVLLLQSKARQISSTILLQAENQILVKKVIEEYSDPIFARMCPDQLI